MDLLSLTLFKQGVGTWQSSNILSILIHSVFLGQTLPPLTLCNFSRSTKKKRQWYQAKLTSEEFVHHRLILLEHENIRDINNCKSGIVLVCKKNLNSQLIWFEYQGLGILKKRVYLKYLDLLISGSKQFELKRSLQSKSIHIQCHQISAVFQYDVCVITLIYHKKWCWQCYF